MPRSQEELERLFGGPDGVRRVKAHVKRNVDAMPPLSQHQKDALRVLISGHARPRQTPAAAPVVTTDAAA